jgi:hypothetical protein
MVTRCPSAVIRTMKEGWQLTSTPSTTWRQHPFLKVTRRVCPRKTQRLTKAPAHGLGQHEVEQHEVEQHEVGQHEVGQHEVGQHEVGQHEVGQHFVRKEVVQGEQQLAKEPKLDRVLLVQRQAMTRIPPRLCIRGEEGFGP